MSYGDPIPQVPVTEMLLQWFSRFTAVFMGILLAMVTYSFIMRWQYESAFTKAMQERPVTVGKK